LDHGSANPDRESYGVFNFNGDKNDNDDSESTNTYKVFNGGSNGLLIPQLQ